MSGNQSRGDKSEQSQQQYRRSSGRSGGGAQQQRNYSGGGPKGGATAPSSYSSNRSFKKVNNNAQGGQGRVSSQNVNPDSNNSSGANNARVAVQNGAHLQPPLRGVSDAPETDNAGKPSDVPTQKSSRGVPKAPSQNVVTPSSSTAPPTTPAKAPGDASRSFPLQFGSISPGFMNGMQIPARTSSAPPNLDEQKQDQARHESAKVTPVIPAPTVPKQQLPRKDLGAVDQPKAAEVTPVSNAMRDSQFSAATATTQTQKPSVHPISGVNMQMPFHPIQIPHQFGGQNSQMQSQGIANTPMPIPIQLPLGNPSQQQVFVPGIQPHPMQPHPMQPQGIMHQGQSMSFSSQMGSPQLPPQLGNIGISLGPQYQQQQAGKFGSARKAVKITHPDTHEELRLDGGSSGSRAHPNLPSLSQPIPSFPPGHAINYYHNSFNPNLFYQAPSSLPLASQINPSSQPQRLFNQVTVKPAAGLHGEKPPVDSQSATSSAGVDKAEFPKTSRPHGESNSSHSQKDSEINIKGSLCQSNSTAAPVPNFPPPTEIAAASSRKLNVNSLSSAVAPVPSEGSEIARMETVRSVAIKDETKKPGKKDLVVPQDQHGQSSSLSSFPSQSPMTSEAVMDDAREVLSTAVGVSIPDTSPKLSHAGAEGQASNEMSENEKTAVTSLEIESTKCEISELPKQAEMVTTDGSKVNESREEKSSRLNLEHANAIVQTEEISVVCATTTGNESRSGETSNVNLDESSSSCKEDKTSEKLLATDPEASLLNLGSCTDSDARKTLASDDSSSKCDQMGGKELSVRESGTLVEERPGISVSLPDTTARVESTESTIASSDLLSPSELGAKDKSLLETNKGKSTAARGKKKRKEILKNADAQGTTSDLYMAYKGPEEKKETSPPADSLEDSTSVASKQSSAGASEGDVSDEKSVHSKHEPDDWEDVADGSTPKLEASDGGSLVHGGAKDHGEEANEGLAKKYSRDFLSKFSEECTALPPDFEITPDISDLFISKGAVPREFPSPGRSVDRTMSGPRLDRHGSGIMIDDDKWNRLPGPLDIGIMGNVVGFRPGQGGNYGVLRNPRGQAPIYTGGILSGPMHSPGAHGGMQRYNPDSDRWLRTNSFQKGLIPSPQTPLQAMHKAERKYEVGKVTDEEQAKQRQLKGILNKLTPQNFEKLFEQVIQVNIDNAGTLSDVISQIFDKALMEPTFCEMYANFCSRLAQVLPDFSEDNEKITFKRLLLNKCQDEFGRGEREQEEANRTEEEGEVKQTEEEREEKRIKARRRMLGNIRLIGELYKKKMLTERIMHECIKKLLGQYQNPDEEDIEALCKLMSTIGEMIDHPKAKEHMDAYFDMMSKLSNNMKLSSRVRFMLKDSIDLRKNKWQQRRKVEGPKKIEDVHRDVAQERQAQSRNLARGTSFNSSVRRGQPMDYGPRGSTILPSPNSQMGSLRGLPQQLRGYGNQDARFEERHTFENRALALPLRPVGDESITLGPQGGLARGMSIRGQPLMQNIPMANMPSPADNRTVAIGPNGYGSVSDRTLYGSREEFIPRYVPERFVPPPAYDQSNSQDHNISFGNRDMRNPDLTFDRAMPTSQPGQGGAPASGQNVSSEKSEERLRDMSIETIKEFYSLQDSKEVVLCIKDLNAPSFYPSMISIWVIDSFERKDVERDLLAKLLINLTRSQDITLSQDQLVKGFESVLATLEDTVNDAPKAAEFLGHIFAKILLENAIPYNEVWRLIYEGGEEQGRLVEIGLAAEVVGVILEIIRSEKGDPFLTEMRAGSNLLLENFRPPNSKKPLRLDKFIKTK